jgi:hypothetical protein
MVRRRAVTVALALGIGLSVTPGPVAAPSVTSAVPTTTAVVIDQLVPGVNQNIVQTYTSPESNVLVDWNNVSELIVTFSSPASASRRIVLSPGVGESLSEGTYDAAPAGGAYLSIDDGSQANCAISTFTINRIDPNPVAGTPIAYADFNEVSASFVQECGEAGTNLHGEIRAKSTDPLSSIGPQSDPWLDVAAQLYAETYVGEPSAPGTVTLVNRGNTELQFQGLAGLRLSPVAAQRWTITATTCQSAIAPGGTCTITGVVNDWQPMHLTDWLEVDVSTSRGKFYVYLRSFVQATAFVPILPTRLVDTRSGKGISSALVSKQARTFPVEEQASGDPDHNIPPEAVAVVGNLTITRQSTAGHAALTTTAVNDPTTSTLNVPLRDTRANGTIVRLAAAGTLGLTWVGGTGSTAHAIFDATGYFVPFPEPPRGNFRPANPQFRAVDSRINLGFAGALRPNVPKTFTVPLGGVDADAITGNLTVVKPSGAGHVSLGPTPVTNPTTSSLNFPAGDTRANNVIVKLGASDQLSITYVGPAGTTAHVILDITGTFGHDGQYGYVPLIPNRIVDSRINQGIVGRIQAGSYKYAQFRDRAPADPSRNVPTYWAFNGQGMPINALTGNATIVLPTKPGHLSVVGTAPTGGPPGTSSINSPAGDVRANGIVLPEPSFIFFWYQAATGGSTHVVFDVTGYFVI